MNSFRYSVCLLCLLAVRLVTGAPVLPAVAPQANSQHPVIGKYLNPGGDFYLFMDGGRWAERMDEALAKVKEAIAVAFDNGNDQDDMTTVFYFVERFLRDCGVRDIMGVGGSSVQVAKDLHHNRMFVQHPGGGPKGFLWDALTAENRPLGFLRCLPAETVLARWATVRPQPVWAWVKTAVSECGNPKVTRGFQEAMAELDKQGIDLDALLGSLTGGVGMLATLDPARMITLPMARGKTLQVPAFGGAVLVEVKNDALFDLLATQLAKDHPEAKRVEKDGIRAIVFPEENVEDSGLMLRVTLARFDKYLVLATTDTLVETLAAKQGGLVGTPHFERWQEGIAPEGFACLYMSPVFTRTLYDMIVKSIETGDEDAAAVFAAVCEPLREVSNWSVTMRTPDGVAVVANQSMGIAQFLLTHVQAINSPILAGMLLPALSQAREKARRISDMANLKQIGLGLIMYANDHQEKLPDDLAALMADEYIRTGAVYICPASRTKRPNTPEEVRAGQCDYLYFGKGKTEDEAGTEVPVACTKPGLFSRGYMNVLYGDGHVQAHFRMPPEVQKLIEGAAQK